LTLRLRAERSSKGTSRIYTITVVCTDAAGNQSTSVVTVTVPRMFYVSFPIEGFRVMNRSVVNSVAFHAFRPLLALKTVPG
jgi:hypothetical protein